MTSRTLHYDYRKLPPDRIPLRAGPLRMVFEPATGFLRYIALGEKEVLRGIYAAVRDSNRGTVPFATRKVELSQGNRGFVLHFEALAEEGDISFAWKGYISGTAAGRVRFEVEGTALTSFLSNRIGLCVLHPHTCAGVPCVVEQVHGGREKGTFPKFIAPEQPFINLAAIAHRITDHLWVRVECEGEVFEMEDQRNWSDASFKTYGTPLHLPFPVEIEAGAEVRQVVTLSLRGAVPENAHGRLEDDVKVVVDTTTGTGLPRIGLGVTGFNFPLSDREVLRLEQLKLTHLRVDLHLKEQSYGDQLRRAACEASTLSVPLELALFVTDEAEAQLHGVSKHVKAIKPRVGTVLVFHEDESVTSNAWITVARRLLSKHVPGARFGGGTNANFAELNRSWPAQDVFDVVCFSLNPQVHAFDNASLVENLEVQGIVLESARRIAGKASVIVTPVTLRPRFNAVATKTREHTNPDALPPEVDPRQPLLFAAGWTLGSIKYLARAGAASITYYETVGWRGVMESEFGAPMPDRFSSRPGDVFPLYHVFADVGAFAGGQAHPVSSSDPLGVVGLALTRGAQGCVLLANVSDVEKLVELSLPSEHTTVYGRMLDASTLFKAAREPEAFRAESKKYAVSRDTTHRFLLAPHAYLRLDVQGMKEIHDA